MKLGLYMATQWRQGADLGPELANLIEQVRASRASGLASLMVGQHFVSSPLQLGAALLSIGIFASIYHPVGTAMISVVVAKKKPK